jgi:cytochrome c oxidase subunit 4
MTIQHDPANVNNPEHLEHHVVGPRTYAIVFGTLLLCTLLTVLAAQVEMGVLNAIVALAIACSSFCSSCTSSISRT